PDPHIHSLHLPAPHLSLSMPPRPPRSTLFPYTTLFRSHHLSQVINVSQERSFFDFINRYRIDHAKGLLSDPARAGNILEIALASGFNSKASFNRVFKKETGMTPSAFKKRLLSEQVKEHLAR